MTTKEEKGMCNQSRRSCCSSSHPAWLISTLSEMDEKMKMLALSTRAKEGDATDTFAQRAESYYQKRPQLLALLQDLYNAYLTLADRYSQTQTLAKHNNHHHHRRQSSTPSQFQAVEGQEDANSYDEEDYYDSGTVSDVESSLSYQPLQPLLPNNLMHGKLDVEAMIAEVVMKNVECDILLHEVSMVDRRFGESTRKIELQKSLLEVLESERMILLNENVRLGYKVSTLMEENKGLVSESLFMKRKAGELARCVLKMREDHRVCMLSRKIEDLQGQIYGLEKRNKDYYEQLMKRDQEVEEQLLQSKNSNSNKKKKKKKKNLGLEGCFQVHKLKTVENIADVNVNVNVNVNGNGNGNGNDGGKAFKWWERVKNLDLLICGPNPTSI